MIITTNHVIKKYEIQYFIYGNYRQVEQPGVGAGICKACATRMQAISPEFKFFGRNTGPHLPRGPGLKPRYPHCKSGPGCDVDSSL